MIHTYFTTFLHLVYPTASTSASSSSNLSCNFMHYRILQELPCSPPFVSLFHSFPLFAVFILLIIHQIIRRMSEWLARGVNIIFTAVRLPQFIIKYPQQAERITTTHHHHLCIWRRERRHITMHTITAATDTQKKLVDPASANFFLKNTT